MKPSAGDGVSASPPSERLPILAMVSTAVRRDLTAPLSHFSRLRVRHFYRTASYGDLTKEELADGSLVVYRTAFDLFRRLWKSRPDIIQNVEPFSLRLLLCLYAVYLVALIRRTPLFLVTLENRPLSRKYGRSLAGLLRLALTPVFRSARAIVCLNDGSARNVLEVGPHNDKLKRLMYGTWGADLSEFRPDGEKHSFNLDPGPFLLFVGRLHAEKGVFDLLEAFRIVREQVPSVRLVLVGDGPERATIEREISRNGWTDSVALTGTVKNRELPAYFRSADLFVAPSITTPKWEEQVGMSIIQAMASGVAVVSTRSGAIPEYLPQAAGIMVEEHAPAPLATAILGLLNDTRLREQMAQHGRTYAAEHYDAQRNVRAAEELILSLYRPTAADLLARNERSSPSQLGGSNRIKALNPNHKR